MLTIPGLDNIELLCENEHSFICRGTNRDNAPPFLYKILKKEFLSTLVDKELEKEFKLSSTLSSDKTIAMLEYLSVDSAPAIMMEDFDGIPLLENPGFDSYSLENLLRLAITITSGLEDMHKENVVLCNLNPSQILYNPMTRQLKFTDFSQAQLFPVTRHGRFNLPFPVNLLPYISPEQTGRIFRDIDHRSDFYSLGICLYQFFSGELPFSATGPTEYIHLHIARNPTPPHTKNRAIPRLVSKIILKLLNKTAENRYQSCKGLLHDLNLCLNSYKKTSSIADFSLGTKDISETFKISEKLYGRNKEIALILNEFGNIQGGESRMLLVAGTSGIGKSSLVNSLRKPVAQRHGYFLSGKFDQVPSDVPYMPVVSAFQGFVNQILAEGDKAVLHWKERILSFIGKRGKIIIDVIPEVEFIIGKQPEVPELAPQENENRFSQTLTTFVHACSSKDRPLVLFLDDMQWADSATLKFIEHFLVRQKTEGILILGTYRDNEVPDSHPLHLTITRIIQSGQTLPTVELIPLSVKDVENLIADTLFLSREKISSLAAMCLEKTTGNPFFIKQFLRAAHFQNHISYNTNLGQWQWDERAVAAMEITDNLLNLQIKNLKNLDKGTIKILTFAACLGNKFDLKTLAAVCQQSEETILSSLKGLGDIITGVDKAASISSIVDLTIHRTSHTYRFSHDQLQRVAYSLLSKEERKKTHLIVGMRLKSMESHVGGFSRIFDVTGHLNIGADLLESHDEKLHLARLNLLAGQKALSSAASLSAFNYLRAGLKVLPAKSWKENYKLALSLHTEAAEAAYMSSNFKEAERLFRKIISKTTDLLDLAKAYSIQIRALKAQNMSSQAVITGIEILRKFGVHLRTNPGKLEILFSFLKTKRLLANKSREDILNLPLVNNQRVAAIMSLLLDIGTASYYANPAMVPLIAAKEIQLALTHGNSAESSTMGFPTYAFLECGIPFGNIEKGYRFGQLSLSLQKHFSTSRPIPQITYVVNNLIIHWKEHLNNTLSPLKQAYNECLEAGDFEIAANSAYAYSYRLFLIGHNLESTAEKMAMYRDTIERLGHKIPLYRHQLFQQAVENLRSGGRQPETFSGKHYSEEILVPLHKTADDKTTLFLFYLMKLMQSLLFQKYDEAYTASEKAKPYIDSVTSSVFVPLYSFYLALTLLAKHNDAKFFNRISLRLQISSHLKKLRGWAKHCPDNYLHKWYLITAEVARIDGAQDKALNFYNKAMVAAEKSGYTQDLALTHELIALYLFSIDRDQLAIPHIHKAWRYYYKWGATAKTEHIEEKFSHITHLGDFNKGEVTPHTASSTDLVANSNLDVNAIIKATRTLTGKIFEDDFLKNLMEIMLENAGAQRGFLLFETTNGWLVKIQGNLGNEGVEVRSLSGNNFTKRLSFNIVNYVARTKESVVLDNASGEGLFTQDRYVLKYKPKSVLCTPVIHQGNISCIVYLENNLTTGAFSPERQEILHLLGSHAAISLKNSNLFNELEKTVEKLHLEIKKRKETQLQLLHAEKLSALGRLSASIAHEFGNPLIGIRYLFQDIQQRFDLSHEDKKLIDIGVDECQRMKMLIRDMQQLNRPSSSVKKHFTPHKPLENVLLFQNKTMKACGINVVKKFDTDIAGILAIEDQITQVLVNITLNAVDAMTENGGTLTITTNQDAEFLNILIKDTGVGISPENQDNIFEPFFSTKQNVEGTGLGLPVSYSIIKNHGGNISFTSTVGEGTTFHIRLPNNLPEAN